ncbi:DUF4351 domain-containing protein [Alkalinema pantanalense CENA528]|uniref:DUF4351 domain-containing protein n=1 Tax=Alkalinema pantanalense TaxID=1620705 RepID=UPI003D6F514B
MVRDAEMPKRYADKLVEVHRLSGERAIVICHIEVQNEDESGFEARMYSYNYRLRDRYNVELKAFEEARQMKYVTTWERMAEERGEERGLISGERAILIRLLNRKFGSLDDHTLDQINTLSIAQLESLGEALLDFASLA